LRQRTAGTVGIDEDKLPLLTFPGVGVTFELSAVAERYHDRPGFINPPDSLAHQSREAAPRPGPQRRLGVDLSGQIHPFDFRPPQIRPLRLAAPRDKDFGDPLPAGFSKFIEV